MATTLPRAPVWVRNPPQDDPEQMHSRSSAVLAILTAKRIFGAGGQTPAYNYSPCLTYDDPPVWQWQPPRNTALLATPVLNPFTPFTFKFGYDDPPVWDRPIIGRSIALPITPFKPFFPPTWKFDYDDSPVWDRPIHARSVVLPNTPFKPFFTTELPATYEDSPPWQLPSSRNDTLFASLVITSPFAPITWNVGFDDSAVWQGPPLQALALNLPPAPTPPTPPVILPPPAPTRGGSYYDPEWWPEHRKFPYPEGALDPEDRRKIRRAIERAIYGEPAAVVDKIAEDLGARVTMPMARLYEGLVAQTGRISQLDSLERKIEALHLALALEIQRQHEIDEEEIAILLASI